MHGHDEPRTSNRCSFVNNLFMWESSAPTNSDAGAQLNRQLMNSFGNVTNEQLFQTCRSIINRFHSHSSDDDQIASDDEENDEQGGLTPRGSKKKGPHAFVLQLDVQNIHLAANAPLVSSTGRRGDALILLVGRKASEGSASLHYQHR